SSRARAAARSRAGRRGWAAPAGASRPAGAGPRRAKGRPPRARGAGTGGARGAPPVGPAAGGLVGEGEADDLAGRGREVDPAAGDDGLEDGPHGEVVGPDGHAGGDVEGAE